MQMLIEKFSFPVLYMDNIPTWIALAVSSVVAITVAILVQVFVVPWQRKKILGESKNGNPVKFTFGDSDGKIPHIFLALAMNSQPYSF